MCWCLRVYWTVLHNLFVRFLTRVSYAAYNSCAYFRRACCGFHNCSCQKHKKAQCTSGSLTLFEFIDDMLIRERSSANLEHEHEYVIVDDVDANYIQIERRKIEVEDYYRTIDRITAEDMLSGREDGACLVRPFKQMDISIKYIISIYAYNQYFHLFIRQVGGKELYGIGQEKPKEKLFNSPNEIIDHYSYNPIICANKTTTHCLILKPILA